jgi:hypothetical protein
VPNIVCGNHDWIILMLGNSSRLLRATLVASLMFLPFLACQNDAPSQPVDAPPPAASPASSSVQSPIYATSVYTDQADQLAAGAGGGSGHKKGAGGMGGAGK